MRRLALTPRQKVRAALWAETHMDRVREHKRAYQRRHSTVGHTIPCQTLLCLGNWIRTGHNGRRQFCDECRPIQYEYHKRRVA